MAFHVQYVRNFSYLNSKFKVLFNIQYARGITPFLFLNRRLNIGGKADYPEFVRVARSDDFNNFKKQMKVETEDKYNEDDTWGSVSADPTSIFDPNIIGYQYYLDEVAWRLYNTEQEANTADAVVKQRIDLLLNNVKKLDPVSIIPLNINSVQPNEIIYFLGIGGIGGYRFSLFKNISGGSIDYITGKYKAGLVEGVDTVRVSDANYSYAFSQITVSDSFTGESIYNLESSL